MLSYFDSILGAIQEASEQLLPPKKSTDTSALFFCYVFLFFTVWKPAFIFVSKFVQHQPWYQHQHQPGCYRNVTQTSSFLSVVFNYNIATRHFVWMIWSSIFCVHYCVCARVCAHYLVFTILCFISKMASISSVFAKQIESPASVCHKWSGVVWCDMVWCVAV